jgi:cobalt/nickel transport system permease protein
VASWFASTHPDGLEWAMAKVSGKEELESPEAGIHASLAKVQGKTAYFPDYGFKSAAAATNSIEPSEAAPEPWPSVMAGTSVSGIVGGLITLVVACLIGFALKARSVPRACGNR